MIDTVLGVGLSGKEARNPNGVVIVAPYGHLDLLRKKSAGFPSRLRGSDSHQALHRGLHLRWCPHFI